MAALMRLNQLRSAAALLQTSSAVARPALASQLAARLIGTTPKSTATPAAAAPVPANTGKVCNDKNWVSYGFDFRDQATDRSAMRASYFFSVTLCLVWGTFVWAYLPDPQMRDWAQRQGHLTLREREQRGEEPISANYVDPARITLPSEEDLEGVEIII